MFKQFIRATDEYSTYYKPIPAPILRKNFKLDFVPEKSELFICVSGFYELYINGKNITKTRLAPFVNNPDHLLYYDDYEVSQYLQKGENAVAVILGNGFANQDSPRIDFNKCPFRAPLVMSLYLKTENGKEQFVLESDESFKVHSSPILYDMYRFGIIYDAREEIDGFASGDFDDSSWENAKFAIPPKGKITLSTAVPITDQYELKPKVVEKLHDVYYFHDNEKKPIEDTYVKEGWWFDFGYARAGVCRLKIKGERGQKITLRHSESAWYGKFNMNTTITLKEGDEEYLHLFQADTYILKGGEEEIFVPAFTYHGFRYVLVEGLKDEQVTEDLLTYIVFNTDVKKRSGFSCSDEILNTLYNMGISSDLSNMMHVPTDCPAREKNGWTPDASLSACQFLLSFDISENIRMWMESIRYAQKEDGQLPGVIPTHSWGYHWGNGPVSDSVITSLPYYVYKFCGRIDIFEENAELISRYFRYIAGTRDERGLITKGLPDWCQAPIPGAKEHRICPTDVVTTMQLYEMLERAAFLFDVIGNNEEKEYALNLKAELKTAMREHLIDFETYTVSGFCQTSQVLALEYGIFEPDEYEKGYKRLLDIIKYDNYTIASGIVGLRNIFHCLFRNGDSDIALRMIAKEGGPSYRDMIDRGGTALFECLIQNGVQESENHHMNGDIVNLFISKLAAMIFGGTEKERIQLTENSLSTPQEGLTNFAETYIDFNHDYALVTNYHRELDLNTACVTVCYTYEGVDYKREYIASYPDKVLAIKFSASEKGKLNFTLKPQIPYLSEIPPVKNGEVKKDNGDIVLSGYFGEWNIKYEGIFRVITCGGEKYFVNNCDNATIEIKNADSAEIFIAIGTNYPMGKTSVYFGEDRLREGTDPHEKLKDAIEKATEKGYGEIRSSQLTDYQKYFDRVHLDLGEDMPKIPTDMLVKEYSEGKLSTYLEVLMFQYGRYLLISSSREGAMPANLQGLWNRYKKGICKVGYWHNINTQMNYWPTFVTNLTEMYKCYTDYFDTLVPNVKTQSAEIIKEHVLENYDENGDNGWNISTGMTPFFSYVIYGGGYSGNVCGAFTCETFWDYYLFTKDKELLKNWVYPMLYGNANYMSRIVVKQKDGLYLTENSGSPENHVDFTPKGTFFDQMMTYDVMRHTLEAAKILGIDESSDENLKRIRERVDKLSPVAIGTSGQIKEFREETYYSEFGEKEHRHISHLAGVYPGTVIDSNTPSWLDSVQTTLDLRGDFGSGWAWAMAHRACVWARTKNSCRTYDLIKRQLGTRTWKNLFAAQIAFQIEGNFGYSSAIAEMLVQSPKEDCDRKARFVKFLSEKYGLKDKCVPIGMSCGGAHAVRFAGYYPSLVECMFIDAPVLNYCDFPGKFGNVTCEKVWENEFLKTYPGMTRAKLLDFPHHPMNMAEILIEHKIPIIMLYGTEDSTVIYNENGAFFEEAYKDAPELLNVVKREYQGHHPHGIPQNPEIIVNFILKHIN